MTESLELKLVTLLGEKLKEPVYELILPTKTGQIVVLPGHEPLVTLLNPDVMAVRRHKDDPNMKLEFIAISGGVAKITQTEVVILADEAESDREIAEKEAKIAYDRAVAAAEKVTDQLELEEAKRLVQRQAVRLKVAELRRRYRDMK